MQEQLYNAAGTREWKPIGEGVKRRIRSFDRHIMAVEVAFEAGGIGSPHTHTHHQLTYCLSGKFRFNVEGREVILSEGGTLIFPADALHGCVALEAGTLLDVFTPVREDFLVADGLMD